MKKPRLYLDTSVFGGYYDDEFKEFTIPLFKRIKTGEFIILYSTMLEKEIELAPKHVQKLTQSLNNNQVEFVIETNDAVELASQYVVENVVGQTSYPDCLRIALATINRADLLVSWNFKHIVNIQRIRNYNSINIKNGYKQLEIRSPRDLMNHEN